MGTSPHDRRARNARGSPARRRRLRAWIMAEFGDGTRAPCAFGCGTVVDDETMTIDRYPVAGWEGGRYVEGNVRPACKACNDEDGQRTQPAWQDRVRALSRRLGATFRE